MLLTSVLQLVNITFSVFVVTHGPKDAGSIQSHNVIGSGRNSNDILPICRLHFFSRLGKRCKNRSIFPYAKGIERTGGNGNNVFPFTDI